MVTAAIPRGRKRSSPAAQPTHSVCGESYAFPSDLGWIAIAWTNSKLIGFAMGHSSASAAFASLERNHSSQAVAEPPEWIRQLAGRLQAYAAGQPDDFRDVPLDLSHLTEFQRRVVDQCRRIPAGRTLTYGELAAKSGYPGAARAVGNTMARNRFPIVIPCHRVVGSGGGLGGFSAPSGICLKERMLQLEGRPTRISRRPR